MTIDLKQVTKNKGKGARNQAQENTIEKQYILKMDVPETIHSVTVGPINMFGRLIPRSYFLASITSR